MKLSFFFLVIVGVLLLVGCPRKVALRVINNSSIPAELMGENSIYRLLPAASVDLEIGSKLIFWEKDAQGHNISSLRVKYAEEVVVYPLNFSPAPDWKGSAAVDKFALSLERDRTLTVRKVSESDGSLSHSFVSIKPLKLK